MGDMERYEGMEAYPPARWRLLITGFADGATNMAIDEAIMRGVLEGLAPSTLRFYGWEPPCVSIGYSQSLEKEIDLARCAGAGVDWVRRPTGGRAILHVDELTYSVVTRLDDPRAAGGVVESYRRLSRGLVAGLSLLGVPAIQAEYQRNENTNGFSSACFDVPSHYEVTVDGKKLVGSAQVRRQGVLLQHGTLPLYGDITRLVDYLRLDSDAEREALRRKLAQRAATLETALGRRVEFEEAARAMAQGFAQALNLELVAGELTPQEREWAEEGRRLRYANPEWNAQR
jgi:lipoate-protein ligase A